MIKVQAMEDSQSQTKKSSGFIKTLLLILITLVIAAAGTAYGIKMYPQVLGLSKGQVQAQAESDKLISEVGKLIALPSDEKPTIATVSDVEKVKDQLFFKNAKNGDKVLIYTNAKKAILYRPTEKRIVEVGAVNINQQPQPQSTDQATVRPTATPSSSPSSE